MTTRREKVAKAFESEKLSAIAKLANQLQAETGCKRTEALVAADKLYSKGG